MRRSALLLAALLLLAATSAHATRMRAVVPGYQYPTLGTMWADLAAAAPTLPLAVILDPANGPGTVADPNYVSAVNAVRAAGGRVYGYVYTHYAARGADTVLADAARYPSFYPIDGVFVDEVTADADPAHLAYYTGLVAGIHTALPGLPVMGNPGISCDSAYVTTAHFDELVTFEHHAGYDTWVPAAWMLAQPPTRFVHLVYARHSVAAMLDAVRRASQRNVASVYVAEDSLPNPWDALPSWWAAEKAAIETTTVAPAGLDATPPARRGAALALAGNPARGAAWFRLAAARTARALQVLDAQGRLVRTLDVPPGAGDVRWDGRDANGRPSPAGVYFARLVGAAGAPALRFALLD